ncbi:MAG: DUF5723 family protein [Mucinivorans sp.]
MIKKYILFAFTALFCLTSVAQTSIKSGYFLPGMFNRHKLNPSAINRTAYVGVPIVSDLNLQVSTNLGAGKLLFPMAGGGLTTFMNGSVGATDFLSALAPNNHFDFNLSTDILSGGFYAKDAYHTINFGLRSFSGANIPYALFDFMKSGMTSPDVTQYHIENLRLRTTNYLDLAYGYARQINEHWTVGAKLKVLFGLADVNARIDKMDISMSQDEWLVNSQGILDVAAPGNLTFKTAIDGSINGFALNNIALAGAGAAIDLGATYRTPVEGLTLSFSIIDLGFIVWDRSSRATTSSNPFVFKGFDNIPTGGGGGIPLDQQINDLKDQAMKLIKFNAQAGTSARTTMIRPTLNVGIEYEIVPETFSVGLLSSTHYDPSFTVTELILSANYRPNSWFNAALTADWSNVSFSWGAIVNFCPRFINFFVGFDYFLTDITPQWIPMNNANPMVSVGLNVPILKRDKYIRNRR